MAEPGDKSKIIIDEDWKSQVQREKEELERSKESPQAAGAAHGGQAAGGLPPPTLSILFTTLATQAMVSMGQIAHPVTGQPEVFLGEAKHFIDTIEMLESKTAGNRTPQESLLLENLLHELRLVYVSVQSQPLAAETHPSQGQEPPS